jgi:hypothetical protein
MDRIHQRNHAVQQIALAEDSWEKKV